MGNLLGAPITEKETHNGTSDCGELQYGLSSMQGWRVHMEDAHIAEPTLYALQDDTTKIVLPGHSLFAVFDGHGGTYSALYCGNNLLRVLSKQAKFVEYAKFCQDRQSNTPTNAAEKVQYLRNGIDALEQAFRDCFVELDQEIGLAIKGNLHPDYNKPYHSKESKEEEKNKKVEDKSVSDNNNNNNSDDIMAAASRAAANHASALDDDGDSGTTACVVMVTPDWLVCANAGDSRAVFSKSGRSIPLSYDHKPDDEEEERRIRAAGGYVAGGRVEGDLAVSRGLGDFRFKHLPTVLEMQRNEEKGTMNPGDQKVSPIPDVLLQNRSPEDEFLIVACDGIWDVRTNPECVQEVAQMFQEGESDVGLLCEELLDACLRLGSKDNMTALVVQFKAQSIGEGGGVMARRKEREEQMKEDASQATADNIDEKQQEESA